MSSTLRADEPVFFHARQATELDLKISGRIVTGERTPFARWALSETLSTCFPCFRYTIARQPTLRRRISPPASRWPTGRLRSSTPPNIADAGRHSPRRTRDPGIEFRLAGRPLNSAVRSRPAANPYWSSMSRQVSGAVMVDRMSSNAELAKTAIQSARALAVV
jgi:hypothetical protein